MKKTGIAILGVWSVMILASIALWVGAIYVVYHFVTKYW